MTWGKLSYSILLISVLSLLLFSSCSLVQSDPETDDYEFDFSQSDHQWEAFFSNYPDGWGEKMELASDYRSLPEPLNTGKQALYIRGYNQSDDLKMLFRRQVTGLKPNTSYTVSYTVEFATSSPTNCIGIGGAPGEAVKVVVDASYQKPKAYLDDADYYRLNLVNEDGGHEWFTNATIGHIGNDKSSCSDHQFEKKTLRSNDHQTITTDSDGSVWLLFGSRSGFEGTTELYYTYFKAEFAK
ncbi:MAG: hypothetical protein ACQETE_00750 [Bacteroidota bacterium]